MTTETLTHDEAVRRARALVPMLVAAQEETERRTYYSPEIHQAIIDADLFQLTHPRAYGGYELGLDTFFEVVVELTRGDASVGMMYCLLAGHTVGVAAYWPEGAQRELLGDGPFIAPLTVAPSALAPRVDGGWRVDGTVPLCTGAPYATHYWGHATYTDEAARPQILQCIIPRSGWSVIEDWRGALGLRGSGALSIRVDNAFVPDLLVMAPSNAMLFAPVDGETPGSRLHGNPLYVGRPISWFATNFTAVAVGLLHAAIDAFTELMSTESTMIPPIVPWQEDDGVLALLGEAVGKAASADALLHGALRHVDKRARSGSFDAADDMLVARMSGETVELCWNMVQRLVRWSGPTQLSGGSRMERVYRDFSQLYFHNGYLMEVDTAAVDLGRARLGLAAPAGRRTFLG